jgi:hypothetical protein
VRARFSGDSSRLIEAVPVAAEAGSHEHDPSAGARFSGNSSHLIEAVPVAAEAGSHKRLSTVGAGFSGDPDQVDRSGARQDDSGSTSHQPAP